MTPDLITRKEGRAGRITFNRPQALNALSHEMSLALEAALDAWRDDPEVALVLIDAEGDRAFCAGGDIAAMYHAGRARDFEGPRQFWRDEYRMNAKLAEYPKPVVALMQGFVMGGGVGVGGNASHRVVGESVQIAMPECGIGMVPDVGGSLILASAPGALGEYLGLTGARMGPGDAIYAGFADLYVPEADWPALKARLVDTGDPAAVAAAALPAPEAPLAAEQDLIDACFGRDSVGEIIASLATVGGNFAEAALKVLRRNSPLSMAATLLLVRRVRGTDIRFALTQEYRFTSRTLPEGDFIEGVRAQIIDKDRNPRWKHPAPEAVTAAEVEAMLAPLGAGELTLA